MNVYVAGVIGLLGVLLLIAGVHGKGTQLFTALTGSPAPAAGGALPPGHVAGQASPAPGGGTTGRSPGGLPGVLTGPVLTA